ncbi:MAG: cobalt-precorrin 5A hydrolase [Euryarchaeota archaeon]|nr:cobalt-precorrin 5A hydrolase [Euryarchaeota archaeon]
MRIAVVYLTRNGARLARRIAGALPEHQVEAFGRHGSFGKKLEEPLSQFFARALRSFDAVVCIMALGIVVRTLAKNLRGKGHDPAVLCIDELGRHVISVVSGHRGANRLAELVASRIDAEPVITTSTDVQGLPSVEELAERLKLVVEEGDLKAVNAAIANHRKVVVFTDLKIEVEPFEVRPLEELPRCEGDACIVITNRLLGPPPRPFALLRPKNLVLGVGARRGVAKERVLSAIRGALREARLSIASVRAIATLPGKAEEPGIAQAAASLGVEVVSVPVEEVRRVEGRFRGSEFVRRSVGVAVVAEPCAFLASGGGRLLLGKRAYGGVTIAIAEVEHA